MCEAFHSLMSLHGLMGESSRMRGSERWPQAGFGHAHSATAGHSKVKFSSQSSWVLAFMFIFSRGILW